jgi:hypothetical protein
MWVIFINHYTPPADSLPNILLETEEETHSPSLQVAELLNSMVFGTPFSTNTTKT